MSPESSITMPGDALDLALHHHRAGRAVDAESVYRHILSLQPDHCDALHLLGVLHGQTGRFDSAVDLISHAIAVNPRIPEYHSNLGELFRRNNRLPEAVASLRRAVELNPTMAEAHNNLGCTLQLSRQYDQALAEFAQAVRLKPDYADAHWNYARLLLTTGDFALGLDEFEWRTEIPYMRLKRGLTQKQWDGSDPAGKTILLHAEGGFGDALQFARYVPLLQNRGAKLLLECQPPLVPLFACLPGIDRILARGDPLPQFDWHMPLWGLPRIMRTRIDTIPNAVPYLHAPADKIRRWAQRLSADPSFKVGLCWAGSPGGCERRTRSLQYFAPLGRVPDIRLFSLQVGPEAAETRPPGMDVADFSADLLDFAEAAALTHHMDLIVTVDTSIAHLAGAMAKLTWVLVPDEVDFRWMLDRQDTPWYPTMRLFRQQTDGDWTAAFQQIAVALSSLVKNR